eukprot:UC4_evm1s589
MVVVVVFAQNFFTIGCATESNGQQACAPLYDDEKPLNKQPCSNNANYYCQEMGLGQAGDALRSSLGENAKYIWAVGLIAAGQVSTMTGTYAGQFVMEGFIKWSIAPWKRVLLTRCLALIPAISIAIIADSSSDSNLLDDLM